MFVNPLQLNTSMVHDRNRLVSISRGSYSLLFMIVQVCKQAYQLHVLFEFS